MPVTAKLSRRFYEALGDDVAGEVDVCLLDRDFGTVGGIDSGTDKVNQPLAGSAAERRHQ